MDFGLSVLDVSPVSSGSDGAQALRNTLELSRLADQLGYERYWLAEHHNLPSSGGSASGAHRPRHRARSGHRPRDGHGLAPLTGRA
jgi:alkanesulfonate monooxygenase SsuD/methylene tetrahydromethanopterin reductase-like flavin-dependent oxidoreductase (luciferase family)